MVKYVIDASSLIELEVRYPIDIPIFQPIYHKLNQMFECGELFSVREAFEELKDSQSYWDDYEEYFRELTDKESGNVAELLNSEEFSVFISHGMNENDGYWADPHLIACAMADSDITVVSEESSRNHPQRSMPFVCEQLGVRCIKVLQFLDEINIR
ncbi:DUF4411 family protein [uncultured Methanobrevibacter sp.]|uniref:DUF4411 family protein n=1 Tax=uncultured Methanobrevibacter sp. TaxID=253161 RepID=UPI00263411FD|nr:DUF4411 family protein [uncultured Methanobrevibacter sp.]